jgi:Integrin-alpha FG-GAP repeat-containing protein 2
MALFINNSALRTPTSNIDYCPLSSSRMRSPNVSTEIVGSIKTGSDNIDKGLPYTVSTTDGTLMLVQDENILWYAFSNLQTFK